MRDDSWLRWGTGLMMLGGLIVVAYGTIFFVNNFTGFFEMGLGPEEVGKDEAEIKAFSSSLHHYISHLHIAVAALLATTGFFILLLTWYGVRRLRQLWAWAGALLIATFALATVLPSHYPYDFDTIGHLGLAYLAAAVFFAGALLSLPAVLRARG